MTVQEAWETGEATGKQTTSVITELAIPADASTELFTAKEAI